MPTYSGNQWEPNIRCVCKSEIHLMTTSLHVMCMIKHINVFENLVFSDKLQNHIPNEQKRGKTG